MITRSLILLSLHFILPLIIIAQDIHWTGNQNKNWSNASNWNPQQIPNVNNDVYFDDASPGNFDVSFSNGDQCKNLYVIASGYTFEIKNNDLIEIGEDLVLGIGNSFDCGGTVDVGYDFDCYGFFDNNKKGELLVGGKISIQSTGQIANYGIGNNEPVIQAYALDNFGLLNNDTKGICEITDRFNNYGTCTVNNEATMEIGDYLYNTGNLTVSLLAEMRVIATFENYGNFTVTGTGTFNGDNNLLLQNYGNCFIFENAEATDIFDVENYGVFINNNVFGAGDFYNFNTGTLSNSSEFTIDFTVENDGEITNTGSFYIGDVLTITANATIMNSGCFEVVNDISNSGAYTGSLLSHASVYGPGSYTYNRDMGGGGPEMESAGWHYISTPVVYMGTHDIFDYWIKSWDETQDTWFEFCSGGVPCVACPPLDFEVMRGYSIKRNLDYECDAINPGTGNVIEFTGTMNDVASGFMSIDVSGSDFEPGDPNDINNWNLIGNPYPSAIDADAMVFPAEIDNAVYYYNDATLSYESFVGGGRSTICSGCTRLFRSCKHPGNMECFA